MDVMDVFIRIDAKGHWRGVDHRSSIGGLGEEFGYWEDGISCYKIYFDDIAASIESLRRYWMEIAMLKQPQDYKDKQITVFAGEKIGSGHDWEDLATCSKTLLELDAEPIMEKLIHLYDEYDFEDISEEEYQKGIEELFSFLKEAKV